MAQRVKRHTQIQTTASTWPLFYHISLLCLCGYFHSIRITSNEILWNKGLIRQSYGGSTRYLTIWGQYLTYLYIFISCINDVAHLLDLSAKKRTLALINNMFYPICTLTTMIGILYWTIHMINPDLLFPQKQRPYYPMILNVFQHAGSGIMMWTDAVFCGKTVYSKFIHHLATIMMSFGYQSWITFCFFVNGFHCYPFLEHLSPIQHVIFFIVVVTIGFCVQSALFFVIETFHTQIDYKSNKKT